MDILTPWLESAAVVGVALAAFLLGRFCSQLPKSYWLIGYFVPLGIILVYCLAMFVPELALKPPISWMTSGRSRFASFNFLAILLLTAPLMRLPQKRTRWVIGGLMVVLTAVSVVPFLAPAFNRSYLLSLTTRLDVNGVCRQSNEYTCGPASAVTALRRLGFPAEEGQIAVQAHTSSLTGTEPDILAKVLAKRYGPEGLEVEYRAFQNIEELRSAGLTIAVVKFNSLLDHCVTILGVETNQVLVGDPLSGLEAVPIKDFEEKWLYVGVVLKRSPAKSLHHAP
jgi:hypothetical protein